MTGGRREVLSEEEARALWERAMEMQMEAARREDEATSGVLLGAGDAGHGLPVEGLPVDEVTAAAVEAGIEREYLTLALVEREVTRKQLRWLGSRSGRASRRLLPDQPRAIEVTRSVRADPGAVLAAVQRVFPALPYLLELEDSWGEDPTRDGILVFRVPGMQGYSQGATFSWDMACGTVSHLLLSIRPGESGHDAGSGGGSTSRVTIRAPLLEHTRQSYWLGLISAGVLGLGGGGVGVALGISLLGAAGVPALVGGALLAGAVGLGAGGGGVVGAWGARGAYRWGMGKSRESLERLLQVLDVNARTGGTFPGTSVAPGGTLPRVPG